MLAKFSNFVSLSSNFHLLIELFVCNIFATFLDRIYEANQLRHCVYLTKGEQTQVEFIFKKENYKSFKTKIHSFNQASVWHQLM